MFKDQNIQIWLRSSVFIYYLKHIEYDNLEIYLAFEHVIDAFNAQQTKFYMYFFNKWEKKSSFRVDLFTFTKESLNGKLHFLCDAGSRNIDLDKVETRSQW